MNKNQGGPRWILSNPWSWAGVGLAFSALAAAAGLPLGSTVIDLRFLMCVLGLLACGVGLVIRLRSAEPAFVDRLSDSLQKTHRLCLVAGLCLIAVCVTALAATALFLTVREENPTLKLGGPVLIWFLIAPMTIQAIQNVWLRLASKEPVSAQEESSLLLLVFGLASFCSCWALFAADEPREWDSFRMVFAVAASVASAAAPLPVLSQVWRRAVLSVVFILHFAGITTAVLAVNPSPWIVGQIWMRIYRPYLEFMYLNNAYHFYAPEPGPASYLWFRLFYEDPKKKDIYPLWIKLPDYDEKTGKYRYPLALNYQRFLAMTENTASPPALFSLMEPDGVNPADFFRLRAMNTPQGAKEWEKAQGNPILGRKGEQLKPGELLIPMYRHAPIQHQYYPSQAHVMILLESFAQHVCQRRYPDHPEYVLKSVKVYRVRHEIPPQPIGANINRLDPRDPELYRPFYLGEFDAKGKFKDEQDPFLNWHLPVQKEGPDGAVRDWSRRHAGDMRWIWNEKKREWVEGADPVH